MTCVIRYTRRVCSFFSSEEYRIYKKRRVKQSEENKRTREQRRKYNNNIYPLGSRKMAEKTIYYNIGEIERVRERNLKIAKNFAKVIQLLVDKEKIDILTIAYCIYTIH